MRRNFKLNVCVSVSSVFLSNKQCLSYFSIRWAGQQIKLSVEQFPIKYKLLKHLNTFKHLNVGSIETYYACGASFTLLSNIQQALQ